MAFSPWSAGSNTLGLSQDRTSWQKGHGREKLLISWWPGREKKRERAREQGAEDQLESPKSCSNDPHPSTSHHLLFLLSSNNALKLESGPQIARKHTKESEEARQKYGHYKSEMYLHFYLEGCFPRLPSWNQSRSAH